MNCPMSMLQRALMYHFQRRATGREARVSIVLIAMQEVSNHPFTSADAFDEGDNDDFARPKLVALSGKFSFRHYAVPRLVKSGHLVFIISQFRVVFDLLNTSWQFQKILIIFYLFFITCITSRLTR